MGHVTLDGGEVTGTSVDRAGRLRGVIPLVNDERDHYVAVDFPARSKTLYSLGYETESL